MTETIHAPWTAEQVDALNQFQQTGGMHPFTCGGDHPGAARVLDATHSGWICPAPDCGYEQDWAHAFMADPSRWPKFPFGERHGPTPGEIRRMTEPTPAHGCMIDGQPAMPILIGEYHALVAQVAEATALENRLRLAHQARRAKEHQLDDIRRALCDIGVIQVDDPYSHADLADVIRQLGRLDGPGPAAPQAAESACICTEDAWPPHCPCRADEYPPSPAADDGICSGPAPETEPNDSATSPSARARLRDALRRAACEAEGFAWDSDMLEPDEYGDHADAVLAVLYREWPWLRAEAEDATPSRADIVRILTTTRSRAGQQAPGLEFPDHHQPGETGHVGWCALCARDVDALADALLAAFVNSTVRASGQ